MAIGKPKMEIPSSALKVLMYSVKILSYAVNNRRKKENY